MLEQVGQDVMKDYYYIRVRIDSQGVVQKYGIERRILSYIEIENMRQKVTLSEEMANSQAIFIRDMNFGICVSN